MVINETHIRQIVSETVSRLMLEFDMGGAIGRSGGIKSSNLINPKELFKNEYNAMMEIERRKDEDPSYRVPFKKTFENSEAYRVWTNYYKAMMSRPRKRAVKFFDWLKFVCDGKMGRKILAYEVDGSYLFGIWAANCFVAAYFAPVGYTGMAKLLKGICQYDNIIFAVTQDLSPMLEKLGVPKAKKPHDAPWRGKLISKDVFGTSRKAIFVGFRILDFAVKYKKR